MPDNELAAAAAELLEWATTNRATGMYSGTKWQAERVARAYLDANPPDSDELIDAAWLEAVGFTLPHEAGWKPRDPRPDQDQDLWFGETLHWRRHSGEVVVQPVQLPIWRGVLRGVPKTRGDLRLLCRALGIPLTESRNP